MNSTVQEVIRNGLDQQISPFHENYSSLQRPAKGWLRAVRNAIGLSQKEVAKKMSVTSQSYAQFEAAEAKRVIGLATLQKAAEALDCDLVYFVVPRRAIARTFSELAQIHDPAFRHLKRTEHSMALEGQAVGDLKKQKNPEPAK